MVAHVAPAGALRWTEWDHHQRHRHTERYAPYGEVVRDGEPELGAWQGPLLGIAAGLAVAGSAEWLVVAPCDTPFLPSDLAARLVAAAWSADAPLAYAVAGGQRHSACMAVRASLLPDLLGYLRGGDCKVGLWQARMAASKPASTTRPRPS